MKFKIVFIIILTTNYIFDLFVNCKPVLKYNNNKQFKIVQFTDLHYGSDESDDLDNIYGQNNILDYEKPDLVIFSGDMITGYEDQFQNDDYNYYRYWDILTEPLIKRNIPWGITFGNHDGEGFLKNYEILKIDQSYSNLSLSQANSENMHGTSNYILKIYSSDSINSEEDNPASLIYIFDSSTKGCGRYDWGCIHQDQLDWYTNTSEKYNKLNSVAFVHIPPVEVIDLWNNYPVYGLLKETPSCFDNDFLSTLVKTGDVKGLYFGHDHENDYHGNYFGMDLGYGRKSGAGSYSSKKPLGARVLLLSEDPFTISTWIREIDGSLVNQSKIHLPSPSSNIPYYCNLNNSKDIYKLTVIGYIFVGIMALSVVGFLILRYNKRFENNNNNNIKYQELKTF